MGGAPIPIHRPSVGHEELEAVRRVFDSRWLGTGAVTEEFERRLCEVTGAGHAVAVSSGSAALHLALLALELEPGDEVILPSLTHVSGPQSVVAAGGVPRFCDVERETARIDPAEVERLLGSRTRALLPVHYGGFACRMDELRAAVSGRNVVIVEDAAHALGSRYRGQPVGSLGKLACFSFDPVKNVTCGEGGAVTTDDGERASFVRRTQNHGVADDSWRRRAGRRPWEYEATAFGLRYHLSDLNAAVGLAQLERLGGLESRKRSLLERYRAGFAGLDGIEPLEGDLEETCPLLCVVRVVDGRRDALLEHLSGEGIQAWVHFPPCHRQPAFAALSAELPATDQLYRELVTLPLHHELTDDDVDRVVAAVQAFVG